MGRRGFTVARGERRRRPHLGDAQEIGRPARQHAGRQAADPLRRGHRRAAREPRRLHRRVPRRARRRGLVYGMFGHVDAGVLHVRPAIDMKDPGAGEARPRDHRGGRRAHAQVRRPALGRARQGRALRVLARASSARSTRRCRRSRPRSIRATSSTPARSRRPRARAADDRRRADARASSTARSRPRSARDTTRRCTATATAPASTGTRTTRCVPSWKATRERRHSPKGRAQLMREWLRRLAATRRRSRRRGTRCAARPAGATFPARAARNTLARERAGLLARGQGGDGRLPRVQVLRRASARSRSTCRPSAPSSSSSITAATCGR